MRPLAPSAFSRLLLLFAVCCGLAAACALQDTIGPEVHAVYVRSVKLDPATQNPVVLLVERSGEQRELPIWVGLPQAEAIALGLEDVSLPRPSTHDLLLRLIEQMGGHMKRVVVTELRGDTYYAVVEFEVDGRALSLDARPSDAIALAVRGKVDIFATDAVLQPGSPVAEQVKPLDVQWRMPDARSRREFECVLETGSLSTI